MTNKISYLAMKKFYEEIIEGTLFNESAIQMHGWSKKEFLDNLEHEIAASVDEEYLEFAIEAPITLQ